MSKYSSQLQQACSYFRPSARPPCAQAHTAAHKAACVDAVTIKARESRLAEMKEGLFAPSLLISDRRLHDLRPKSDKRDSGCSSSPHCSAPPFRTLLEDAGVMTRACCRASNHHFIRQLADERVESGLTKTFVQKAKQSKRRGLVAIFLPTLSPPSLRHTYTHTHTHSPSTCRGVLLPSCWFKSAYMISSRSFSLLYHYSQLVPPHTPPSHQL